MPEPVVQADPQVTPTPQADALPGEWAGKSAREIYDAYEAQRTAAEAYKAAAAGRDPEAVKEVWSWASQTAQAIREGRLTEKQAQQIAESHQQATQTTPDNDGFSFPDNYDDLTPRQQAQLLTQQMQAANAKELAKLVQAEAAKYGEQIKGWTSQQENEKSLLFNVLQAKLNNPKLDINTALQKAASLKSATPDQLLQMAIDQLGQPDNDTVVNEKVSKLVAEKMQKLENDKLEAMLGTSGARRKISLKHNKKSNEEVNRALAREWMKGGFGGNF